MPLNGYPITGKGETCTQEMAAPEAGTPLPSRPERARANNASRWKPPPVVASNADAGDTSMKGPTP
jgi:hypothetical protein